MNPAVLSTYKTFMWEAGFTISWLEPKFSCQYINVYMWSGRIISSYSQRSSRTQYSCREGRYLVLFQVFYSTEGSWDHGIIQVWRDLRHQTVQWFFQEFLGASGGKKGHTFTFSCVSYLSVPDTVKNEGLNPNLSTRTFQSNRKGKFACSWEWPFKTQNNYKVFY